MMLSIREYVEILIGQDIWRKIQGVHPTLAGCGRFIDWKSYRSAGCSRRCQRNTRSRHSSKQGKNMKYRSALIVVFAVALCFIFTSRSLAQVTRIKVGYSSIGVGQSLVWVAK
jgi:hypothetical protein